MDSCLHSLKCLKTIKVSSKWMFIACLLVLIIPYVISVDTFENTLSVDEFEECLNLRNSIPNQYSVTFNVTKVNNHIEILVHQDDKYDYYELNASGGCFTAVREVMKPIRTPIEQMQCDSKSLDNEKFKCGYEVIKNDTHAVVLIHSSDGVYEYIIDTITKETELYLYHHFIQFLPEKEDKCLNRKYTSDFHIPLEVTKKPRNSDGSRNYLEILIKYEGKYDLYVTQESGYVRYVQLKLQDKPTLSLSDYSGEFECSLPVNHVQDHLKDFQCPLKVVENENYVNISVNAFHSEHRYVVDKISNDMKYFKIEDSRYLTDADRNYNAEMDKCMDEINNKTYPFPVEVRRNKDFLEIWVEFNKTFDVYKTTESGTHMCEIIKSPQKSPKHVWKSLAHVRPNCLSCDGPAFTYNCPNVGTTEDEDIEKLEIGYAEGVGTIITEYQRKKSTGEISLVLRGWASIENIPTIIKSLVG